MTERKNKQPDDETYAWPDEEELAVQRSPWLRLVAFITVLFFIGVTILPVWTAIKTNTPLADVMLESLHLKENVDAELLDAVVKLEVLSGKPGSAIAMGQKSGTGFNISSDGIIVTNHHVIEGAHKITVTFPNGKRYSAKSWAGKPEYDLGLVKLEQSNLPTVALNFNNPPMPGDALIVVGNPMDINNVVVAGELKQYVLVKNKTGAMLCIDVPIYPGNSGSPVFDIDGRVVGVVFGNAVVEENGTEKTYGLAIPIREIRSLLQ